MRLRRASARVALALLALPLGAARAQTVEDGSEAILGKADTQAIVAMVARHLKSPDAKLSVLRRASGGAEGRVVCGSVDVKNRMGLYTGPRGFVADLADGFFGRIPDGPELLSPSRMEDYRAMERTRALYFARCLD